MEKEKSEVEIRHRLAEYAEVLQEEIACLLCGSIHQPHVVDADDVSEDLGVVLQSIEKVKKEQVTVQQRKNEIDQILNEKRIFDEQLVAEQNSLLIKNLKIGRAHV